jgi:hypothetical protein
MDTKEIKKRVSKAKKDNNIFNYDPQTDNVFNVMHNFKMPKFKVETMNDKQINRLEELKNKNKNNKK